MHHRAPAPWQYPRKAQHQSEPPNIARGARVTMRRPSRARDAPLPADRHGIYTHSEAQADVAEASKQKLQMAAAGQTVHTEVLPAQKWWDAEDYHRTWCHGS